MVVTPSNVKSKKKTSVTAKGSLLALYAAEAPCLENIYFWIYFIHKFNKVRFPLFTQKLGAVPEAPSCLMISWKEKFRATRVTDPLIFYRRDVFLFHFSFFFFFSLFVFNLYSNLTPPKLKNSGRLMVPPVQQGFISLFPPLNSVCLCVVWQWFVQLASPVWHILKLTRAHLRVLNWYKKKVDTKRLVQI